MDDRTSSATEDNPTRTQLCDEIGRAVGSLWQRKSGVRPASVSTEYVGDVVRCTIEEGEATAEADGEAPQADNAIGASGYQTQAQAAVTRLTGRAVMGFATKSAKDSEAVTNAFILERIRVRY